MWLDPTHTVVAAAGRRIGPAESSAKRGFDFVVAGLALVLIAPLMLAIAIAIRLERPGPVLFVQRRTGLGGVAIRVIKFRTMTVMEDGAGVDHACRNDRRVTGVGAFLRRSSLDELPQLINVLRGEMSLVGPRPHALAHDQHYGAVVSGYVQRFRARPGMTGLAQAAGHRGEIRALADMQRRIAADNRYIDRWSFGLDLAILLRTMAVAAFQDRAY